MSKNNDKPEINMEFLYQIFNYTSQTQHYFKIPDWQRNYAWTEQNVKELFYDLFHYYKNSPDESYFLGSMIVIPVKENEDQNYEVIDGQQRLTTLTMFISIINYLLKEKNRNSYVVGYKDYYGEPSDQEMLTVKKIDQEFFKPFLSKHENRLEGLNTVTMDSLPIGQQKMLRTYQILKGELLKIESHLLKFREYMMKKVYILKIVVNGTHELALNIFNSINNRGSLLCEYDLIKAQFKNQEDQERWNDLEDNLLKNGEKGIDNFQLLFNYLLSIETEFQETVLNKKTIDYFLEKRQEKKFTFYSSSKDSKTIMDMIVEFGDIYNYIKFFNLWDSKNQKNYDDFVKHSNSNIQKLRLEEAKLLISIQYFMHERPYNAKSYSKKLQERLLPIIIYFFWKNQTKSTDSEKKLESIYKDRIYFLKKFEKLLIQRELLQESKEESFQDANEILKDLKTNGNFLGGMFTRSELEKLINFDFFGSKLERFKAKYFIVKCEMNLNPSINGICRAITKDTKLENINSSPPKNSKWKDKLGNLILIENNLSLKTRDTNYAESRVILKNNQSCFTTTNLAFELTSGENEKKFVTSLFYERNAILFIILGRTFGLNINLKELKKNLHLDSLSDQLERLLKDEDEMIPEIQDIFIPTIKGENTIETDVPIDSSPIKSQESILSSSPSVKRKRSEDSSPNKRKRDIPLEVEQALEKFENEAKGRKFSIVPHDLINLLLNVLNTIETHLNDRIPKTIKIRLRVFLDWGEVNYTKKISKLKEIANIKKEMEDCLSKLKRAIEEHTKSLVIEHQKTQKLELQKTKSDIEILTKEELYEYSNKLDYKRSYFQKKNIKDLFKKSLKLFEKYLSKYFEAKMIEKTEKDEKKFKSAYIQAIIKEIVDYFPKNSFTEKKLIDKYEKMKKEDDEKKKEKKEE